MSTLSPGGAKNAVQIVSFHPYLYPSGHPDQTRHLNIVLPSNYMALVYSGPPNNPATTVELRAHNEVTKGGIPLQAAPGAPGPVGPQGPIPQHQWQGTALGFENLTGGFGPYVDLKGDKGDQGVQGTQGDPGADGADGETPVPVWTGTSLEWQLPDGTPITAPVDLQGPQGIQGVPGLNGATVWISAHPTLQGVQVLHIVPAGTPTGTAPQTYNIGMGEVDDFEYVPADKRLRITTQDNVEFEVDLSNLISATELTAALAPYLTIAAHTSSLQTLDGLDGQAFTRTHTL